MDYIIQNTRPEHTYTMVPNALITDLSLSHLARMALIYMCSRPAGYLMRMREVREALGVGPHAWQRAARELRARGALIDSKTRHPVTGRMMGTTVCVTWEPWLAPQPSINREEITDQPEPVTESRKTRPSGNPTRPRPKSDSTEAEIRLLNKRERSKTHARAREERDAAIDWYLANPGACYSAWENSIERMELLERQRGRWPQSPAEVPRARAFATA